MTSTVLRDPSPSLSLPDSGTGDGAVAPRMPTTDDVVDKMLFSLLRGE